MRFFRRAIGQDTKNVWTRQASKDKVKGVKLWLAVYAFEIPWIDIKER